ncbi:hypothetical protein [Corynebacterium sp. UBA2622]|uniref:hypothetical protein n=1 Tax=Corynebacterium sp. UBA2622 TaxID=1946393 RepID=UPI0025BE6E0B|nr:hypothetical protein [Corynebacterium sp. UBA2622]
MIPVQLRAGGAFLAIALVLLIYTALAFFRSEPTFAFTAQVITIIVAAAIFGANATFVRGQRHTRAQVGALAGAVALVIIGILLPATPLFVTQTFWLILWAVTGILCALILRRSAM